MKVNTKAEAWDCLMKALNELMEDLGQEPGEMTPEVMLMGELGVTSMDAIHLIIAVEDIIGKPLSYKEMLEREAGEAADISLGQLWDLICRSLRITA